MDPLKYIFQRLPRLFGLLPGIGMHAWAAGLLLIIGLGVRDCGLG
jgi:hypothetical protein